MARRYGQGDETHAQISLTKPVFDSLAKSNPELVPYEEDFKYNDTVDLNICDLDIEDLEKLIVLLNKSGESSQARAVAGYLSIFLRPSEVKIGNLKTMEMATVGWLRENLIRGWVFNVETGFPALVTGVNYYRRTEDSPAHTNVQIQYWAQGELKNRYFTAYRSDVLKNTVAEIFMKWGYIHETPELIAEFDVLEQRGLDELPKVGTQYIFDGKHKVVNDYDCERTQIKLRVANNLLLKSKSDDEQIESQVTRIPVHPWIRGFDLGAHQGGWYRLTDLSPYVYNPDLRNRLILPPDHIELIESLVSNLDVLTEDVVAGKSGGTTILCQGPPGVGKTLTAEIYSEVVQKPLYRFHSGQLGIKPKELEESLKGVLERAERWNAVPLIDEADVFLMSRGADLQRNAVVGVFLRVLEYYKGLLFLTTNRLDSIDDAIISRCIAVIKYGNPAPAEREKIWRTQLDLCGVELPTDEVRILAEHFNCSGRDIKGLARLTSRYCTAKNKTPEFADFKKMAAFRGL